MFQKMTCSIVTVVALALAVAIPLAAQQNPPDQGQPSGPRHMGPPPLLGTITSVGVDRFAIKKRDGTAQTVMVNDQTHYAERTGQQRPPQELQLEDLKVGDHVVVRGAPNTDQQFVAERVNRITEEMFERFENFQAGGGPGGGPGTQGYGGGWHRGGEGMQGTRAGGEIVSIDGNQINVHGFRGDRTIVVNDQTKFSKDGQSITLKDLKVGDRIFALGKEDNGKFVATEVRSGFPGGMHRGGQNPQN